jgi:hypothetical protein
MKYLPKHTASARLTPIVATACLKLRGGKAASSRRTPKKRNALKMDSEFAEAGEEDEFAGAALKLLVLEDPGGVVRNEDGVEAGLKSGIDVASRAVADHPAVGLDDFELRDDALVGLRIFFGDNFDGVEISGEAGALDFGGLRGGFAFAEKNQAMTFAEIGKSFGDAFENARRHGVEFFGHFVDFLNDFLAGHAAGEFEISVFEGAAETADTVTVLLDIAALGFVQNVAAVFGCVGKMREAVEEAADGLLEENIIFPERIIGIDENGLTGHGFLCARAFCRHQEALRTPATRRSRIPLASFWVSPNCVKYS